MNFSGLPPEAVRLFSQLRIPLAAHNPYAFNGSVNSSPLGHNLSDVEHAEQIVKMPSEDISKIVADRILNRVSIALEEARKNHSSIDPDTVVYHSPLKQLVMGEVKLPESPPQIVESDVSEDNLSSNENNG